MREFCLTEEILQQFVDGELSLEQSEGAAKHLAACQACAGLLSEVEQENALLTQAFAPEMSLSVPTARLRERLDAAIAELEPQKPRAIMSESTGLSRLSGWFASLFGSLSLTPQRAMGFASVAVVIAFAAIFVVIQMRHVKEEPKVVAKNDVTPRVVESPVKEVEGVRPGTADDGNDVQDGSRATKDVKVNYIRPPKVRPRQPANTASKPVEETPKATGTQLLPGEKSYLEAIASLTTAIEANKDDVLRPTVRADYERNLAVVDQAIATTRQQAKRNPNDPNAVEFMYTAYQNKIDLLNAVADQTRIASR